MTPPPHRSEKRQNQCRQVVAWLSCNREVMDNKDARLCEELISLVGITDKRRTN